MQINQINNFLKRYNLFAFQYRVFYRLCLFIYKNRTEINSPNLIHHQLNPEMKHINYNLRNPLVFNIDKHLNKFSNTSLKYYFIKITTFINIDIFSEHY